MSACRELVEQHRARADAQLERMRSERESLLADGSVRDDAPFILMTISAGEHAARAAIDWADETLARLAELAADEDAS